MKSYPRLPAKVSAPGGDVTVHLLKHPTVNGIEVWGSWETAKRRIEINSTNARDIQWHTLYHELMHVALTDSGAKQMFKNKEQELLCDAVATARMRERFG